MKRILGVVGFCVVAGAAAYVILKKLNKNKDDTSKKSFGGVTDNVDIGFEEDNIADEKASCVNTISERHEEASTIIQDAVENICRRTSLFTDDNDSLDQISEELDELLKEV